MQLLSLDHVRTSEFRANVDSKQGQVGRRSGLVQERILVVCTVCLGRCSRTCSANLAQHGVVWGGVLSAFLLVLFDLVYFRSSPLQPGSWLCADSVSVGCSFDPMSSVCWAVLCCHICLPTYMPCSWRNPIPTNPLSSVSFFERICVPLRRH
ncbi:hypothetical protein M432DRAFT_399278 [Thermoascus aurantiacus ATCC 26904]